MQLNADEILKELQQYSAQRDQLFQLAHQTAGIIGYLQSQLEKLNKEAQEKIKLEREQAAMQAELLKLKEDNNVEVDEQVKEEA